MQFGDGMRRTSSTKGFPILAAVIIVLILAAVDYVFVVTPNLAQEWYGFTPGVNIWQSEPVEYGYEVVLTAPTSSVEWGDLTIWLSDGSDTVIWNNISTRALSGEHPPETWHYGSAQPLGILKVFMNITDQGANGKMSSYDLITITTTSDATFSPTGRYNLTLIFEPSSGTMLGTEDWRNVVAPW